MDGLALQTKKKTSTEAIACYGSLILVTLVCMFVAPTDLANMGMWVFVPVVYLLLYALMFKRVIEGMFLSVIITYALAYKTGMFFPFIDGVYTELGSGDLHFVMMLTALFNVFMALIEKAGVLDSFVTFALNRCKTQKSVRIMTWLMAWPLFVDEYMTILTLGPALTPVYDKKQIPREELAMIVHSLTGQIRIIFPVTSWAALLAGVFESGGLTVNGSGYAAFLKTIPFNFYAWVSIIGALLFALGILPKLGKMKDCVPYQEEEEVVEESGNVEEGAFPRKKSNMFDFFAPIVLVVAATFYFEYDIIAALFVMLPVAFAFYLLRGLIVPADIEESLIKGFTDSMPLFVLFAGTYMLSSALDAVGFTNVVIEMGQQFLKPELLPVILFLLFSVTEFPMSLCWGILIIAFPVAIPLAFSIGANPYLTASAILSAVVFGSHGCFVADYTVMTAGVVKIKTYQHAITSLPYVLIFGGITAVLYLIAGFVF